MAPLWSLKAFVVYPEQTDMTPMGIFAVVFFGIGGCFAVNHILDWAAKNIALSTQGIGEPPPLRAAARPAGSGPVVAGG